MSDGPHLILAAFWVDGHDADAAMAVLRGADFLVAEGYPRGAVVAFSHAIAASPHFQDALARVELRDLQPPDDG